MTTVFTGIQPSGRLTIGNLIGALLPARRLRETAECLFCVVDLHALTVAHEPAEVRERSREVATLMLAVLEPIQRRHRELAADPGAVDAVLAGGARRAAERAAPTMAAARRAIGLLPAADPAPVS